MAFRVSAPRRRPRAAAASGAPRCASHAGPRHAVSPISTTRTTTIRITTSRRCSLQPTGRAVGVSTHPRSAPARHMACFVYPIAGQLRAPGFIQRRGTMIDAMIDDVTILPEQFLPTMRCHTAEQRLMIAVLEDAAYIYATRRGRRRGLRVLREVEEWLLSTDTTYVFSFESICDALGIDADGIRSRLFGSSRRARVRRPLE